MGLLIMSSDDNDSLNKNIPVNKTISTEKTSEYKKEEEFGGPKGLEPTRYGDWEVGGRTSDF